jgi:hypothetical protein
MRTDPGFAEWRDEHPKLDVDGQTLFVRGGDMLADEDELLLEWAVESGRIDEEALRELLAPDPQQDGSSGDFHEIEGETG